MAEFINYFWQSFFCLSFFFGVYWVFLRTEKSFRFNRAYLLATPVLALSFPLLEIPVAFDKPSISLENTELLKSLKEQEYIETIGTFRLPEFTVTDTRLPFLWGMKDYLLAAYLIVVVLLSAKLIWQFILLRELEHKGWYQTRFDLKGSFFLIPTFGLAPVFSYFNKLFWDDTQELSSEETSHIIQHEMEHIHQKHTWDLLYYQVLSIVFWFNPVIYLMRMSLIDLHEYLADEKVLGRVEDKSSYPRLIVKMAFKGLDLPIGNYFIRSTTLKRIMMMKKSAKINWFKLMMVIPLTAMLFGLVSMKTEKGLVFLTKSYTLDSGIIKQQVLDAKDSLDVGISVRTIKNPIHYEKIGPLMDGTLTAQLGELEYRFSGISTDDEYVKVMELIDILRGNSQIQKSYSNATYASALNQRPEPTGGWEAFDKYLRSSIEVPEIVEKLGLHGVLEVEFVIGLEGQVLNPVIRRSFGAGIDEQVIRALDASDAPTWNVGKEDNKPVAAVLSYPLGLNFSSRAGAKREPFFRAGSGGARQPIIASNRDGTVFDIVENMPVPPGGMEGWNAYLRQNLKYPEQARISGVEGTVYLIFTVDSEGNVLNPEILRGIGAGCDEEAMRVVENSPKWTPGTQRGQPVSVQMRIPIRFSSNTVSAAGNAIDSLKAMNEDRATGLISPTQEFFIHFQKNIKYPSVARQHAVSGTILAKLIFDKNGRLADSKLVKGVSKELDEEVLSHLKNAPNWSVNGNKDSYQAVFPIEFKLSGQPSDEYNFNKMLGTGVVVVGYGAQSRFQLEKINNGEVITIKVVTDKMVNFGGEILTINDGLARSIEQLVIRHSLDPATITARFEAAPEVKMGSIQDVQEALRKNSINRVLYTFSGQKDKTLNSTPTTGQGQPLVVLDGKVGVSLDLIDPVTIESITVIKEANAMDLYGNAAKDGVILITSKK